ncbi:biotin--[acetyl-CoA-carboxylase] ligase [Candidatus Blochmannia vicinus]|uniref:biotin--[biotin carboxyl-carrier protein] ligase n=1 Tax=Candidatus Blochmannia vicinus (nom. nud.) TaxID=251540 RepID=A0ABY4SUG0_9ENTR|nr:biotin--[acetyl-CoA-carboxylase] ligase [Candidatus Blochmannia vicinus]URJ32873.1 biotin--[acetyl-CoA-carboxylase] ligase [Candidatus Blochmannia vicinus]
MLNSNDNHSFITCSPFLNKFKILTQLPEGKVIVLNEVHSTNQYIIDNIPYIRSGDACVSEHQTQGRGRRGKIWVAPFGESICLSIYWALNKTPPTITELSIMISIVVAKILKNLGVSQIKIKWPNDLYIYGKKLAGILIEIITRSDNIAHIIIGIGINLSMRTSIALNNKIGKNWINLKDIGIILDRNILVATLINTLNKKLKDFIYLGFDPFISYWKIFDYLYNKPIKLLVGNHTIYGTALGINMHGALIVDQSNVTGHYSGDDISVDLS